jgi:hypothetical protein
MYVSLIQMRKVCGSEVTKLWGASPRGRCCFFGGRGVVVCMDVFVLNEIRAQNKIHISVGTVRG